jgi:hypothetical protein
LHNPSRFTQFSLFPLLNLLAGIVLAQLIHESAAVMANASMLKFKLRQTMVLPLIAVLLFLPAWRLLRGYEFPNFNFKTDMDRELCSFLRSTPKTSLIASLSHQADYIPTFAARPVLIAHEYALPYQLGYYRMFRERALALMHAQYTSSPEVLKHFIHQYAVGFIVLDKTAYQPGYLQTSWTREYLDDFSKLSSADSGLTPLLKTMIEPCSVLKTASTITLDAACILRLTQ